MNTFISRGLKNIYKKFSELIEGDEFIMDLERWQKNSKVTAVQVKDGWTYKATTIIMKPDALVKPVGRVKK